MSYMQRSSPRGAPAAFTAGAPCTEPDAGLIASVRKGEMAAYGVLYQRHVAAAYRQAHHLARGRAEADDLVSEAFMKVLCQLRAGNGPDSGFRAYLLTTLKHVKYHKSRRDRRCELTGDVTEVSGVRTESVSQAFCDPVVSGCERSFVARGFAKLPEQWQAVLWHTEIVGMPAHRVAALLGLTPNAVAAKAYRARRALRAEFLQAHLDDTNVDGRCRPTLQWLGAWVRTGESSKSRDNVLPKPLKRLVDSHLEHCENCRARVRELVEFNPRYRPNTRRSHSTREHHKAQVDLRASPLSEAHGIQSDPHPPGRL